MRKFILTLICLFCFSVSCFASEQEAVDIFKTMTNNIVSEIQDNFNQGGKVKYSVDSNKWHKYRNLNLQSAIDVQKTDSLISPYKGILELQADTARYYSITKGQWYYDSKNDAKEASLYEVIPAITKMRFVYMYQDNNWVLKQVQYQFLDEYVWKQNDLKSPQEYFCVTEDN